MFFFFFDRERRTVPGFTIHYDGETLDAMAVGILHTHLQLIVEGVAHEMLVREGFLASSSRQPWARSRARKSPPVRVVVNQIGTGSLIETVSFVVSPLLGDANVLAVLQGLATNVVWELLRCGVPGVRALKSIDPPPARDNKRSPKHTATLLREVIEVFGEVGDCKPTRISIRTHEGDECVIDFGPEAIRKPRG